MYETLFYQHDLRYVALAVGICALSSLTGAAIAQHSLKALPRDRRGWLLLAGLVTGVGVWTTHFAAMLGYRTELDIHFDLVVALASLLLTVGITVLGGLIALHLHERGILAGVIVGIAISIAHFMDMHALHFAGFIRHDPQTSIVAIVAGILLAGTAGHLLVSWKDRTYAWPAAIYLSAAVLVLHFTAMSGVTLTLDESHAAAPTWTASGDGLATVVVAAFLFMLGAAIAYVWHTERLSRATAEEQRQLIIALQTLRETRDHHRAYVELNPQIAWVADPQGNVTEIAPRWTDLVGISQELGVGSGWATAIHPDDLPATQARWQEATQEGNSEKADIRYRLRLIDGSYRWFRARARPRRDDAGAIVAWYGILEDVHDQVLAETALRASEERYRLASLATNDVIWDWSYESHRATWAGAYREVLGYSELETGTDLDWWVSRIHSEDRPRVLSNISKAVESGAEYWHEEYRFLTASDNWIDVKSRCKIVRDTGGNAVQLVGSMLDITQQKQAEAELYWAANHDPLTRLPNRTLYRKRKADAINSARLSGEYVALVLLDLNDFKALNDTLGHAAGDRVLEQVADRMMTSLPAEATVARLGGDEFAIILPGLATSNAYEPHIRNVSERLSSPFNVSGQNIPVSFSAGAAIWPRDAEDSPDLLIAADLALYAAKDEKPGTIREFSPSLKAEAERRSGMLTLARRALDDDGIVPYYQPKINLQSRQIVGWEALLRIRGEDDAILPPSAIEAAFSDTDLTVQITDRMLSKVFADLAGWQREGIHPGRVAVNVSAGDFRHASLADRLRLHAGRTGLAVSAVDIEVTETVLIGQLGPEVLKMIEELRGLGVAVALDDFGTGYASLTHLQQFPVDAIKIDRSFVSQIRENDHKATAVVDAVLQMAKRLNMETIAEGVETSDQARYLRARGCTTAQGYLFSRAVPSSDVGTTISSKGYDEWQVEHTKQTK
nr:bifunctional diguanylate cyclase/phosphodiesterase [Rhizobium sp. Q54]